MTEKLGKKRSIASDSKREMKWLPLPATVSVSLNLFLGFDSKNTQQYLFGREHLFMHFFFTTLTCLLVCVHSTHLIKHLVNANILHSGSPSHFFFPQRGSAALLYSSVWTQRSLGEENKGKKNKNICNQIALCQRATRSSEKSCPVGFTFSLRSVCVIAVTGRAALWVTRSLTASSSAERKRLSFTCDQN